MRIKFIILQNLKTIRKSKNDLRKDVKYNKSSLFSIHDLQSVKLLSHLKINFSILNEHKIRNNFKGCVRPISPRRLETEST